MPYALTYARRRFCPRAAGSIMPIDCLKLNKNIPASRVAMLGPCTQVSIVLKWAWLILEWFMSLPLGALLPAISTNQMSSCSAVWTSTSVSAICQTVCKLCRVLCPNLLEILAFPLDRVGAYIQLHWLLEWMLQIHSEYKSRS